VQGVGIAAEHDLSQEERTLAAEAHGSIVIGLATSGLGGIGAAPAIWLAQRKRSSYVGFLALQAMMYQLLAIRAGQKVSTIGGRHG
jgi:hypothetical protein